MNEKEQLQLQISEAIQQDFVKIVTLYSSTNKINLDDVILLVQKVNLLDVHDVKYIHNNELDEIIELMYQELKNDNTPASLAFLTILDFIKNKVDDFRRFLYVNLCLRTDINYMTESISIFSSISQSVKKLFEDYMNYIFNETFFTLDEQIQIELILKIWGFSREIFHDNEASKYAYEELLKVFNLAIKKEQTEVAFWLYYTPLHYFNSGTGGNINELNEKFKIEVEKPLEEYILNKIVPKYNITPNKNKINKKGKIKVAFVMQRIIKHSTMKVFLRLVKMLMDKKSDKYEFVIYNLNFSESNGSDINYIEEFKKLGIKYIDLHDRVFGNMNPTYSLVRKCIKSREILITDNIDILIGLHTRVEYLFLYVTRTAPKQIYWYHSSNIEYDVKGIDKRITHCLTIPDTNYQINPFVLPLDTKNYDPVVSRKKIDEIRRLYPKDYKILGTIGRLIKLDSWEYLKTIAKIMTINPKTIYLACGSGDKEKLLPQLKKLGIENRFYFPGYVDSHIYGHVIDIWLDSFPLTQGESKSEYFNKKSNHFILSMSKETKEERRKKVGIFLEENKEALESAYLHLNISSDKYKYLIYEVSELLEVFNSTDEYIYKANNLLQQFDNQELKKDIELLKKVYTYILDFISKNSFEKTLQ